MTRDPWLVAAIGASTLLFALATITAADPDLWGHLRVGLDLLDARTITLTDPYSFTQDRPWINHEWLSQAQIAIAYRLGGVAGLALLKGALVFATMALVWSGLRGAAVPARLGGLGIVVLGTGSVLATLRPQLWSLLIFVLLCQILTSRRPHAKRWLPLLFAIWANVHGAWVVGLAMLALWAPLAVWSRRDSLIEWTVVAVASAAATLCTPYGVDLWRFLWETVGFTRELGDWQPILTAPLMNWLPVAIFWSPGACPAMSWYVASAGPVPTLR